MRAESPGAVGADPLESGTELIESYRGMAQREATWLERLGTFDVEQAWRAYGQASCPDWLMTFLELSRATAFEKVRVARMLRRRPILAASFHDGRVSYSKVRAITRLEQIDTEMEQVFTDLAEQAGLTEVEHAVRAYQLHHEQELPPRFRTHRRGCRIRPLGDGLCQVTVIVSEVEASEIELLLEAVIDQDRRRSESPAVDSMPADSFPMPDSFAMPDSLPMDESTAGHESPAVDSAEPGPDPAAGDSETEDWWDAWVVSSQEYAERRLDALLDLLDRARDHFYAATGPVDVADRHLVHLIVDGDGRVTLPDGSPVADEEAAMAMCGAPEVTHEVGVDGNPLYQGRKRREWTTAQRRAAVVRDGHCRFPGCWRRRADLHHQWYWSTGGPTDIDNGFLACRFHHRLMHKEKYRVVGNPGRRLTFIRSDGRTIGYSHPVRR